MLSFQSETCGDLPLVTPFHLAAITCDLPPIIMELMVFLLLFLSGSSDRESRLGSELVESDFCQLSTVIMTDNILITDDWIVRTSKILPIIIYIYFNL